MRAIDLKPIKAHGVSQAAGRALSPGEIHAILQTCANDPSPAGVRDAAIFALAVRGGLRREEMANLGHSAYDVSRPRSPLHALTDSPE